MISAKPSAMPNSCRPPPVFSFRHVALHCGYKYTDLAAHPLAVLIPYSVHSYGVVQAYAMGVPLLAPSPRLLAHWHTTFGLVGHKGPGNVPWRRSTEKRRVPNDGFAWLTHDQLSWWSPQPPNASSSRGNAKGRGASSAFLADPNGCAYDPNDACTPKASEAWLSFAEPYTWPHVATFDSTDELIGLARGLLANRTRRLELSRRMKAFFSREHARAVGHVRVAMHRAMRAAKQQRENKLRAALEREFAGAGATPPAVPA